MLSLAAQEVEFTDIVMVYTNIGDTGSVHCVAVHIRIVHLISLTFANILLTNTLAHLATLPWQSQFAKYFPANP